jgi:bifunctional non-homologous end joining protein LigD
MQKHHARNLHYDLRLELDGVLKSWAVPKDPSFDQTVKRAAFHVEDHPVEYADFEGVIPKGNYGAGPVIVWDRGTWIPLEDPHEGLERGKLLFELKGHKLRGRWTLIKVKRGENEWLLIKERDALEGPGRDTYEHDSVITGRTLEDVREGRDAGERVLEQLRTLEVPRATIRGGAVEVMLAEPRSEPFDHRDWVFELKYDGYRLVAARDESGVVLITRNGNDMTDSFPDIVGALAGLPYDQFIMDGEVVVHDERGLPSFQRLQKRARLRRGADVRRAGVELPASLYVFDLLAYADHDVRNLPLLQRKALLRELIPSAGVLRFSEHIAERGVDFFALAKSLGLEGIVGKRATSLYRSGRSKEWVKIRASLTDDFVIVGVKASSAAPGTFGSFHVAAYDGGDLVYAGSVGTGVTPRHIDEVLAKSPRRKTPAVAGAPKSRADIWLEPELVIEVRYLEWTEAGQLRHPVFLRMRDDKRPEECIGRGGGPPRPETEAEAETETGSEAANADSADVQPAHPATAGRRAAAEKRVVRFTNLDKVLWPEDGYTKGDLVEYYRAIAPWILPYLRDRPVVLTRFPDGIHGKSFFQKDAPEWAPTWLRTATLYSEGSERDLRYFVCDDVDTLLYLANSATIPLHIWASRVATIERPDWCSIDLDPKDAPFESVVVVARGLHRLCDSIGLPSFIKTSGSSGLHVLVPLAGACTHEQARLVAELLARRIVAQLPEVATITRVINQRAGRVYLDYLQNGHGKLLVAPFCVRPLPGAPVSAPLRWSEVDRRLDIRRFTIRTVLRRMERLGEDPVAPVLTTVPDLLGALDALHTHE